MEKFIIREFKECDRAYICRTVLFCLIENDKHSTRINKDSFLSGHNVILNQVLDRAKCLVVADPEENKLIYGFIIYEQSLGNFDVVHFAYVRSQFRGIGLLKNLREVIQTKKFLAVTHLTDSIRPAKLKAYYEKVIFDPYLIIGVKQ